ncbi:hypothetical protein CPB86DRAFT_38467 [Serendipita vermifera]|nr:hypothetical protein CPB86DRAFT_38467 [Serendipita vermifera]
MRGDEKKRGNKYQCYSIRVWVFCILLQPFFSFGFLHLVELCPSPPSAPLPQNERRAKTELQKGPLTGLGYISIS